MNPVRSPRGRRAAVVGLLALVAMLATGTVIFDRHPILVTRDLPATRMRPTDGFAWQAPAWQAPWPLAILGDTTSAPRRSRLVLLDDGVDCGQPHAPHRTIVAEGGGAYCHWHDTLHFSTRDGSDPRSNGRRYEVIIPIRPAPSAVVLAQLALLALSVLIAATGGAALARRLRRHRFPVRGSAGSHPAAADAADAAQHRSTLSDAHRNAASGAGAPGALPMLVVFVTFVLFGLALSSRWEVWCETRGISASDLAAGTPVGNYLLARSDAAHHDFRSISLVAGPIQPHAGAFREFVMPATARPPRRIEVQVSAIALERTDDWQSFHEASDAGRPAFLATPNGIVVDLAGVPAGPGEVTLPVRASRTTILLLGVASAASLGLLIRARRRRRRGIPDPRAGAPFAVGAISAAAVIGVFLLGANAASLVIPLRAPLVDDPAFTTRNGLGPGDVQATWTEARTQLARRDGEADDVYAARMTDLVARTVAHTWIPARAEELRMQVPFWENWLIWLGGELSPSFRNYRFADPRRAIERGVGMCGQVSAALATLLQEQGLDARVALLDGHMLLTLHRDDVQVAILDPDYGVVLPMTLEEARAEASGTVKAAYEEALTRTGAADLTGTLAALERIFAAPLIRVEPAGPVRFFGEHHAARERLLYRLKWMVPIAMIAPWIGLAVLRMSRGRGRG